MKRYAILIGAIPPEKGLQKSLVDFKNFLIGVFIGDLCDEVVKLGYEVAEKAEERGA